ncbi:YfhO family protein, partial [bacterium]|nr:YfhO family protein [bacterium]
YPSYWIRRVLETLPGVDLPRLTFVFLHYILAGIGTFCYLRSRRVGHAGALAGGLAFMLTPHLVGLAGIGHGGKVLTGAYIPLVLMAAHRLLETGGRRWLGLLGLFGGLQFLARHVQVSYYTWIAIGILIVYYAVSAFRDGRPWGETLGRAGLVVGGGVLAAALAAVLLLPLQSYSVLSTRVAEAGGMGFAQATMWSFHPKELLTFLVPSAFGLFNDTYWGPMPFNQVSHYAGFVALALAVVALATRRSRSVRYLGILVAVCFVLSFGKYVTPLYRVLYAALPGFSRFRVPALFLLFAQFGIAALAGHGVSAILGEVRQTAVRWKRWAVGLAGAGIVVGVIVIASRSGIEASAVAALLAKHAGVPPSALRPLAAQAGRMAASGAGILIAFAAAIGVSIFVASTRKLAGWITASLLIGVLVWDIWIVDVRFMHPERMQPLTAYYPETTAVRFLKSQDGIFRIAPLGGEFGSNAWMYHRIESIGGYHPAKLGSYNRLLQLIGIGDLRFLALANVKYVVGPEEDLGHPEFRMVAPGVHEFLATLPRAFLLGEAREVTSDGLVLGEMRTDGFNPGAYALVQGSLPGPVESAEGGTVSITTHEPERIVLQASVPRPCLLYVSEVYYPNGWKAYVDGEETTIYRTNFAFRSVYLESGEHTVEMVYDPPSVRGGLVVTLLGLVAIVLLTVIPRRRTGGAAA